MGDASIFAFWLLAYLCCCLVGVVVVVRLDHSRTKTRRGKAVKVQECFQQGCVVCFGVCSYFRGGLPFR